MPSFNKPTTQTVIEKIHQKDGEITVTLNLNITVNGSGVNISTTAVEEDKQIEDKKAVFAPEEMFELDIPTVDFGKKM